MNTLLGALRHGRKLPWLFAAAIAALLLAGITRADTDTTPPTLISFQLSRTVNSYGGNGQAGFKVTASDDSSGVASVSVHLLDPSSNDGGEADLGGGPNNWAGSASIPEGNDGTWTVDSVVVTDNASNTASYSTSDLQGMGFNTTFTVIDVAPPTISSFAPASGAPNTSVDITGTGFATASEVDFGGVPADTFNPIDDGHITATVPDGAATGPITVITSGGQIDSADSFTVTAPAPSAPSVSGFDPTSGAVGDPVDISGANFTGATDVQFDGTSVGDGNFTVNSDTDITTTVPSGAGTGQITVVGPGGQGTSTDSFTVNGGGGGGGGGNAPTVASFAPTSGAVGAPVDLTGTNFTGATEVDFNGTSVGPDGFTVNSDTDITTSVPNGATTGPITVVGPGGQGQSADDFTVSATPSYAFTIDTAETDASPGDQLNIGATLTPNGPDFNDTIDFYLGGVTPAGFTLDPSVAALPVSGGTPSQETLLINVDPSVAPGDYTVAVFTHAETAPITDQEQDFVVHVAAASLPEGIGQVTEVGTATLPGGTVSVSAGDTLSGVTTWDANISKGPETGTPTLTGPSITANSDNEPSFDSPPDAWPFVTTGSDLASDSDTLDMPQLSQTGNVTSPFDATVTPGSVPVGGGNSTATIDITPQHNASLLSIDINTTGDGFDFGAITDSQQSDLTHGEQQLYQMVDGSKYALDLGNVVGGVTYEVQITTTQDNAGTSGLPWTPEASVTLSQDTNTSATGTSIVVPDAGLGPNGAFTFASSTPTEWNGGSSSGEDVVFPATSSVPTAGDGSGSIQVDPTQVDQSSTGNTLTFTYTADDPGLVGGTLTLLVPDGWDAPTTDSGNGCVTVANPDDGTFNVQTAGQLITISNLTIAGGDSATITYGDTSCGGGATAPDTAGSQEWHVQEASTAGGTLTDLVSGQPSVDVNAPPVPDGAGTMSASPAVFQAGSSGSIDFTYTADTGGLVDGTVAVVVPSDWTPPSTDAGDPGYARLTNGGGDSAQVTIGEDGQTILVSGLNMNSGDTFTLTYGNGVTPGSGTEIFETLEQSTDGGSLTDIAEQPAVTAVAADGSGTADAQDQNGNDPPLVSSSSPGNTLTFVYTADAGGLSNGTVNLTVPAGWSDPSITDPAADGAVTMDTSGLQDQNAQLGLSGRTITVTGLDMNGGDQFSIVYGDTSNGGNGATAPASIGTTTWQMQESSTGGTPVNLTAGSPQVTIAAGNGLGTMTAAPSTFHVGDTVKSITFTYTADPVGMSQGTVELVVPDGWPAPTLDPGAGHVDVVSGGAVTIDGSTITVSNLTLRGNGTFTIRYWPGNQPSSGTTEFETLQQSFDPDSTAQNVEDIATQPTISVVAAPGSGSVDAQDQNGNDPPYVSSGSPGNTLTFTYTADDGGLSNGTVTMLIPNGWSAPVADDGTDTTEQAAGFTTLDNSGLQDANATLSTNGQLITISGLDMNGGDSFAVTYGDTSMGGPGATAPTQTGVGKLVTMEASQGDTLTELTGDGAEPAITVAAADGLGTMTASPTGFHVGDTNKTIAFTYTADAGGLSDGTVALIVPGDWTPPTTDPGPGHVSSNAGQVSIGDDGQTIYVTNLTMNQGQSFKLTYSGATPSGTGSEDWEAQEQFADLDGTHATITDLAAFPSISVVAADGSGTMDVMDELGNDPPLIPKGSAGHTLTFTYTADDGGLSNGTVAMTVPAGWPAPTANTASAALTTYTGPDGSTMGIHNQVITVSGLNMEGGDQFSIVYGDTSSDVGTGVTAPSATGNAAWKTTEQSLPAPQGVATKLAVQPKVAVIGKPKVTGFTPTTVAVGGSVTINGTNLAGVDNPGLGGIEFSDGPTLGDTADADLSTAVVNAAGTAVTVALPDSISPGKWFVQVTNAGGIGGDLSDGGTSPISTAKLTVVPTAEVDTVTPSDAKVNKTITLTGSSLKGTSAVWFTGGVAGAGVSVKPTSIASNGQSLTVKVPAGALTGSVWTMTYGAPSNQADFTVDYVTPTITSVTPGNAAVTATLTITGTHFTGVQDPDNGGDVSVDGESIDPSLINWVSDTKITVPVPSDLDPGVVPVVVTTGGAFGGSSIAKNITIVAPTIAGVAPTSTKVNKTVKITGTSLKGAKLVTFSGGKTAVPTKVATDGTSLTVVVPKGAQTGSFQVSVAGVTIDSGSVVLTITT